MVEESDNKAEGVVISLERTGSDKADGPEEKQLTAEVEFEGRKERFQVPFVSVPWRDYIYEE